MTNPIYPPVSAAAYRAARDASLRACPVLEAKGFHDLAIDARVRALRYDKLAAYVEKADNDAHDG